jgi:hypothetical protein
VIVVCCGRGGDDANGRIESAGKFDGVQVRLGHAPAKFRAAFKKKCTHMLLNSNKKTRQLL